MTPDNRPTPLCFGDAWRAGKVLRCESKRFGVHDLLCVRCPGESTEEKFRAVEVKPDGEIRSALFFSSAKRDVVLEEWPNLRAYYCRTLERRLAAMREALEDIARDQYDAVSARTAQEAIRADDEMEGKS